MVDNALIESHLHIPRHEALRLHLRTPRTVMHDELLSEANVAFVKAARKFDATKPAPFGAYVRMKVRWALLDYLRSLDPLSRDERALARTGVVFDQGGEVIADDLDVFEGDGVGQYQRMLAQERLALAKQALLTVSPRHRTVLILMFMRDWTQREIARHLGCAPSRVHQLYTEALKKIRKRMGANRAL